ncbi:unnamed protein product, partial [Durusdinium trenchii]
MPLLLVAMSFVRSDGRSWDLTGHSLGDTGAIVLADALKGNSSLRTLCLRWNSIQERGASALALALQGTRLNSLDTYCNSFGNGPDLRIEHRPVWGVPHLAEVAFNIWTEPERVPKRNCGNLRHSFYTCYFFFLIANIVTTSKAL